MDPVAIDPSLVDLLVREAITRLPNAGFWLMLFGTAATTWRTGSAHLCDFVRQVLVITDKFVTNGADVRLALTVTHLDGDPPKGKKTEA